MTRHGGRHPPKLSPIDDPARLLPPMPLESALRQARFTSRDRQRFDRHCKILKADRHIVPRFAYNRGCVRVLTDSSDYPWWTVQQVTGNTVHWFVDFPTETPIDALVAFADSVDG